MYDKFQIRTSTFSNSNLKSLDSLSLSLHLSVGGTSRERKMYRTRSWRVQLNFQTRGPVLVVQAKQEQIVYVMEQSCDVRAPTHRGRFWDSSLTISCNSAKKLVGVPPRGELSTYSFPGHTFRTIGSSHMFIGIYPHMLKTVTSGEIYALEYIYSSWYLHRCVELTYPFATHAWVRIETSFLHLQAHIWYPAIGAAITRAWSTRRRQSLAKHCWHDPSHSVYEWYTLCFTSDCVLKGETKQGFAEGSVAVSFSVVW